MKILFIAPYIPNQIRVRPYQWLRALVQRGHDVTLLAVWGSPEEAEDIKTLQAMGVRVVAHKLPKWRSLANAAAALLSSLPLQAVYSVEPHLMQAITTLMAEFQPDVVHVEHLRGAQYGLHAQRIAASRTDADRASLDSKGSRGATLPVPIIWDSVDCISHLFQQAAQHSRSLRGRLMTQLDLQRTQRYEGELVQLFDRVLVTSAADKAALLALALRHQDQQSPQASEAHSRTLDEKVSVLPNGVDLTYFAPAPESDAHQESAARIVFSGKMSYHANITAALHLVQEIMPHVWSKRPDAEVWIVGKDPTPEIRALATDATPASTSSTPVAATAGEITQPKGRVVVTGSVADIRPYLHQATVAAAPIVYGAGIQNKVLEAMACGIPVVASKQAASALAVTNGRELLVAEDAVAFADAIVFLLNNPQYCKEFSRLGRAYVEQKHSWDWASAQLDQVYIQAIQAQHPPITA